MGQQATQLSAPTPSLFDIVFELRQNSKNLERQANRMERDINKEKLKVKDKIEKGDLETAKIFAQNAIRKKNERNNIYRLAARLDGCATQVETAGRTQGIGKMMGKVVQGLDFSMQQMDVDQITQVMDKFETNIEDLNVISEYQNTALQSSSAHLEKPQEVDGLLKEVAAEHNLELENDMVGLGGSESIGNREVVSERNPSSRVANLDVL